MNIPSYDREELWREEIDAFAQIDRIQTPPADAVLFVGSSSFRLWDNLRESFPEFPVINRGFGGSQLQDVNYFFAQIVTPYNPKTIVVYGGDNDLGDGATPERVSEDYRCFAAMAHAQLPASNILYLSPKASPSRWHLADNFRRTNMLIQEQIATDERAQFVDVFNAMLGQNGEPMPDLFNEDELHVNAKGYELWRQILSEYLK